MVLVGLLAATELVASPGPRRGQQLLGPWGYALAGVAGATMVASAVMTKAYLAVEIYPYEHAVPFAVALVVFLILARRTRQPIRTTRGWEGASPPPR